MPASYGAVNTGPQRRGTTDSTRSRKHTPHDHDHGHGEHCDSDHTTDEGGATPLLRDATPLLPDTAAATAQSNAQAAVDAGFKSLQWLQHELTPRSMVVSNLILTLATSMLDVVCYRNYQTFASNQTGNTVLLATAALHIRTDPRKCVLAATSLLTWLTGAFLSGQLRREGRSQRGWLFTSMAVQMVLLLLYCFASSPWAPAAFDRGGQLEWMTMALIAFQSGIQFLMCTNVGIREINAATATAAYAQLVSDPRLFKASHQRGRDRRIVYLVVFWLGCVLGMIFEQSVGSFGAVIAATIIKFTALGVIYHAKPVPVPPTTD